VNYPRFEKYKNIGEDYVIPKKMKAVAMKEPGLENLKILELDVPYPNTNQLLVRVDACTICTSTLKILAQGKEHTYINGWPIESHPVILGDEGSLTVVKVGQNLQNKYQIGEKLCVQPAVDHAPINHREFYRNVETMNKTAVGYTLGGHLSEYMLIMEEVIESNCLVKLPSQTLGYYEVSLSEPVSCCVSAQDHHVHLIFNPSTGERVAVKGLLKNGVTAVFGAGVMGRLHAEVAMSYSPKHLFVFDINPNRFEWITSRLSSQAKKMGVALHCELITPDIANTVYKITGQNFADDIIDATGSARAQENVFGLAGRGSVVNTFGGLKVGEHVVGIDLRKVHYSEMIITGSSGGNWGDTVKVLDLVNQGSIRLGTQIRLVGDLTHAVKFLELMKQGKIDGKAIVYPHTKMDKPYEVPDEWSCEKEIEHLDKTLI